MFDHAIHGLQKEKLRTRTEKFKPLSWLSLHKPNKTISIPSWIGRGGGGGGGRESITVCIESTLDVYRIDFELYRNDVLSKRL